MRKILIILSFMPFLLYGIDNRVDNTSLSNEALGGPHTGMAKGFDSFFNNPALLAEYDSEISIIDLTAHITGDGLSILSLALSGELESSDASTLVDQLEAEGLTSIYLGIDLLGPLTVGKISNNWGWCLKNTTTVYFDLPSLLSTAEAVVREDFTFGLGLAYPVDIYSKDKLIMVFTPGVMSRSTIRGEVAVENDLVGLMDYSSDITSLIDDYPLYISPMFGVDVGFTLKIMDIIMLSGVYKDLYTPILKYEVADIDDVYEVFTSYDDTSGTIVSRELNFGLSSDIPLGPLSIAMSDLDVYLDYYDLLDFDTNFWLHWGAGLDIELLEKLNLMAGINEGLLSLGLNVNVGSFDIGFAMYGSEEGTEPGSNSVFNFLFSMEISF